MRDIGEFNAHVSVMGYADNAWTQLRQTWAYAEKQKGKSLFSAYGLGAEAWRFTMRKQALTCAHRLYWKGSWYLVTAVSHPENGRITVDAALVQHTALRAVRQTGGLTFPGVLTDKYRGYEEGHYGEEVITDVLITPPSVLLRPNDLVYSGSMAYVVAICHNNDPYKAEYELRRREDA